MIFSFVLKMGGVIFVAKHCGDRARRMGKWCGRNQREGRGRDKLMTMSVKCRDGEEISGGMRGMSANLITFAGNFV